MSQIETFNLKKESHVEETEDRDIQIVEPETPLVEVMAYFDTLPAVSLDEMLGVWEGKGIPTGHPLDGLLERYHWFGKDFKSTESIHPLLFTKKDGGIYAANPGWLPISLLQKYPRAFHHPYTISIFKTLGFLLQTRKHKARMRLMDFRGVVTATLIYDNQPIQDIFRRVDANTLIGIMDLKGDSQYYCFMLQRVVLPRYALSSP